ncbi:MAG: DNA recombination protein RmuC [bacterium]
MSIWSVAIGLAGAALGFAVAWILVAGREGKRLAAAETAFEGERVRRQEIESELRQVRGEKDRAAQELVAQRERVDYAERALREQKEFLQGSRRELDDSFRALAAAALKGNTDDFLRLAEERWKAAREQGAQDLEERRRAIQTILSPLQETLSRLESRTGEIEMAREGAYREVKTQLEGLLRATASLQEKTTSLTGALKGSQMQGRWGEIVLENVVELAGMSQHVDFTAQEHVGDRKRPDLVVRLPGERFIAVDSKVSINAYVDAMQATTDDAREEALDRHLAAIRSHVRTLAERDYAQAVSGDVDLVVLFLPGDQFLSAAFARDPDLQLDALRSRVLVATPTTLVALLRTVAIYWQQKAMAENALKIAEIARELYDRAAIFGEHLATVGKGLDAAVSAFNDAAGSFERRLVPLGRRLEELAVTEQSRRTLEPPPRVEETPKAVIRQSDLWS